MGEGTSLHEEDAPLPRRRRLVGLGLAMLIVVALIALWLDRRTLAGRYVGAELARRGVPARYEVADLGVGRQRLVNVVIGDPANPDLVADWLETRVSYDLTGAKLAAVAAGRVRLRARLADGRVSLGSLDRLLPPPSGKPFALPALGLDVADARIRLETPNGVIGIKLTGEGRLNDGFAGRIAAVAPELAAGNCRVTGVSAAMRLRISDAQPSLTGPVRGSLVRCGDAVVTAPRADLAVTFGEALDRWQGKAALRAGSARLPSTSVAALSGDLDFNGSAKATVGTLDFVATRLAAADVSAAHASVTGDYRAGDRIAFTGRARMSEAAVAPSALARATAWRDRAAGTPVEPLARALADAVSRAGQRFDADAQLSATPEAVAVSRLLLASSSGARVAAEGFAIGPRGVRLNGTLAVGGGGLPNARVSLAQAAPGAPVRGQARIAPFATGGASLSLSPVRFTAATNATRITTEARLSGPLGNGRVEDLALSIDLDWRGRNLVFGRGCAPLSWQRLAVSGLTLDPARLQLCPLDGALVRVEGGRVTGGARLAGTRLTGSLGSTPLALSAAGASLRLGDRGFALTDVAARLGRPERETRITLGTLTGRIGQGITGEFANGGGQIANVPLILSAGAGRWQLVNGTLALDGAMTVSDEAAIPRFRPLSARSFALTLANGRIGAGATLHEPTTGTRVADVRIAHLLAAGTGQATIGMAPLTFREGFQPELITPLTFGVVADVRGRVTGDARIAWSPGGVTSTGTFGTEALDLAAAFGPVTGIKTRLAFTDLLGLRTAPRQVATVRTVNPGILVENGTIRYQVAGPARVQVEGAEWPFAGGALTLDPTLLDFSRERERRMTFRVAGASAGAFLQQFDFANLDATGTFDGVLPMIFGDAGGRIEDGRLTMREGGGTIAYVGTLTQQQLGTWGNLAFQALKSLRYRTLSVTLNGPLAGEMVTDVRFAGISQGMGAKSNFLVRRLQRLPFVFNIRIRAPFRGLLDSAQSFYDPRRLIQRNLPALLEEQNKRAPPPTVQPPASGVLR